MASVRDYLGRVKELIKDDSKLFRDNRGCNGVAVDGHDSRLTPDHGRTKVGRQQRHLSTFFDVFGRSIEPPEVEPGVRLMIEASLLVVLIVLVSTVPLTPGAEKSVGNNDIYHSSWTSSNGKRSLLR